MAERSTVNTLTQIGPETTPGTPVAASKRFVGLNIIPEIQVENRLFRPEGRKYPTLQQLNKEWVTARYDGIPCFAELAYIFNGLLGAVTPTQIGTSAFWKWVFTPSQTALATLKTFTFEHGSPERALQFAYGVFSEFTLDFNRSDVMIGGSILGQKISDGFSMTSASDLEQMPIVADQLSVYADNTWATLGTTKLTALVSGKVSIAGTWNPFWVVDSALTSFKALVEKPPTAQITLMLEADAQGMGLLTTMRGEATKFIRIKTPATVGAQDYLLQIDAAVKITKPNAFSDQDGVYAIEFVSDVVYDATGTKALEITLQNKVSAL